jgi:hypothetical protein
MTITIDRPIQQKPLSFEEFLDRYGGDDRYYTDRWRVKCGMLKLD